MENEDMMNALILAEETINEAIEVLENASRKYHTTVNGQMNAYLIPWLKIWVESNNQNGSISNLMKMLEDERLENERNEDI
jgi:hypothetical protein